MSLQRILKDNLAFKAPTIEGCGAPCKGTVFQWVRTPPGNYRSGRQQSEQSRRDGRLKPSV